MSWHKEMILRAGRAVLSGVAALTATSGGASFQDTLMPFKPVKIFWMLLLLTLPATAPGCKPFWEWDWSSLDNKSNVDTQAMTAYGQRLLDEGNLSEALKAFQKALDANPNQPDARIGIGDIYKVRGDYHKAAEHYEVAVKTAPQNFQANYKLGLMYHLLNRIRQAIDQYLVSLAIDPNSFEANLNIATAYLQIDQAQLALPYAENAVRLNPRSQHAHVNIGSVYSALNLHEKAIIAYRQAAEYGELEPPIAMNLVNALLKMNYHQRAINTLNALIARRPTAQYYERMGYTRFKMGEYEEAMKGYRQALDLDGTDVQSLNGLGVCLMTQYIKGGKQQFELRDQAIASWQKSLRHKRDQPQIMELITRYQRL